MRVPGQVGLQDEKSVEKVDTLCMHVTRGSLEATHPAHVTREKSGSYPPHPHVNRGKSGSHPPRPRVTREKSGNWVMPKRKGCRIRKGNDFSIFSFSFSFFLFNLECFCAIKIIKINEGIGAHWH